MVDAVRSGQVAAAAMAGEGAARGQQPVQRGAVRSASRPALAQHRPVRVQAEGMQRGQLRVDGAGHFARAVDILDPHDPLAAACRASGQLPNAAGSRPKCSGPVGEGAKRPR